MVIRPVTDLRNHFPDVEKEVRESGEVYLTKNGYAAAVLLSMDEYSSLKSAQTAPSAPRKTDKKSYRGYFHKYADSELIKKEKDAGRLHALENREKYSPEGRDAE